MLVGLTWRNAVESDGTDFKEDVERETQPVDRQTAERVENGTLGAGDGSAVKRPFRTTNVGWEDKEEGPREPGEEKILSIRRRIEPRIVFELRATLAPLRVRFLPSF